jgi:hypothetical protein
MRTVIILAAWLWFLVALTQVTDTGVEYLIGLGLFLSGPAIALVWVVSSLANSSVFRMRWWRWAWLSVPAVGLGAIILLETGWGLVARVWLCDTELQAFAEEVRQGRVEVPRTDSPRRVGLFHVESFSTEADEVRLMSVPAFLDRYGLAYRPESPPDPNDTRYWHSYGPWYRFWDKF